MIDQADFLIFDLLRQVKQKMVVEGNSAFFLDPYFGIVRNRVNSEICKTLIRMNKDTGYVEKIINYMVKCQENDGSWREIHPQYDKPSALVTALIGECLLMALDSYPQEKALEGARNYVLNQERSAGSFLKSSSYIADHLNVNASCGAFLALYGKKFGDDESLMAAERAAKRICQHQTRGFYPYTSDKGNYSYLLNVPCIHYQGVTIYHLSKIYDILNLDWIEKSLKEAAWWLSSVQNQDGRFDWSKSGLMFAYYLNGAYAFAFSSFIYASRWNRGYLSNAEMCLTALSKNVNVLVLRWELDNWNTFIPSLLTTFHTANINGYPLKHRGFRWCYGIYRQIARRRFSEVLKDSDFKVITSLLKLSPSTIEPSRNYPDMFMTSEVMDCLSHSRRELSYL